MSTISTRGHDFNNDHKLDGLELFQAVRHAVDEQVEKLVKFPNQSKKDMSVVYKHLEGIG